jgi:hypothetical protein
VAYSREGGRTGPARSRSQIAVRRRARSLKVARGHPAASRYWTGSRAAGRLATCDPPWSRSVRCPSGTIDWRPDDSRRGHRRRTLLPAAPMSAWPPRFRLTSVRPGALVLLYGSQLCLSVRLTADHGHHVVCDGAGPATVTGRPCRGYPVAERSTADWRRERLAATRQPSGGQRRGARCPSAGPRPAWTAAASPAPPARLPAS